MRKFLLTLAAAAVLLGSCGQSEEKKVLDDAEKSIQRAKAYIDNKREKNESVLKNRLDDVNAQIKKLRDVAEDARQDVQRDLNSPIQKLMREKGELEHKLRLNQRTADTAYQNLKREWDIYYLHLDGVIQRMETMIDTNTAQRQRGRQ